MLKMLTGLAARALRLGKAEEPGTTLPDAGLKGGVAKALAVITDTEMLDWLDRQSSWSGKVAFRWSTTGRGWRLMEVPLAYPGTQEGIVTPPSRRVRKAIADAMLMVSPTDTQAIDWLDEQTGSYTGLVIWRLSTRGRGWRLHETSWEGARATVRETITDAMRREARATAARSEAEMNEWQGKSGVAQPSHMYCITQAGPEAFECAVMAQDGFERWRETSLDAAVESVIRGADTINHASITCNNITIRLKNPVNAAICRKCWDLVISKHRHDFVECKCGLIAVDGGKDYNRRVGSLHDVGEVPTKALFDRLAALSPEDRGKEWVRHG